MKKKSRMLYALLLIAVAGTVLAVFFNLQFIGGLLVGLSVSMALAFFIGSRQLDAAGKRMDKLVKDYKIQIDDDNL